MVTELVGRMGVAIRLVAAVGLAAGLAVLAGAIAAGRRRRQRDAVVFKVLGATRADLVRSYMLEFAMLGGVAALLGAVLGLAAGYVLLEEVMDIAWTCARRDGGGDGACGHRGARCSVSSAHGACCAGAARAWQPLSYDTRHI